MSNYICLHELLKDNELDIDHLVKYYISYISIFYCKKIDFDDEVLNEKINELENYINRKVSE